VGSGYHPKNVNLPIKVSSSHCILEQHNTDRIKLSVLRGKGQDQIILTKKERADYFLLSFLQKENTKG
jgi:hypothetical protein